MMAHDWVFDVLDDLKTYATANGLPALAAKVQEAREVAAVEISALTGSEARILRRDDHDD